MIGIKYGNSKFQDEKFNTIFGNEYVWLSDVRFYNTGSGASMGHQIPVIGKSTFECMRFDVTQNYETYPKYEYICPVVTLNSKIKIVNGTGLNADNAYELKK